MNNCEAMTPEQHQWYWKGFNDAKAQPAVALEQELGVKGYAMALNEVALKLRKRYEHDLLSTPLWLEFEKTRNKFARSIATPLAQPEQEPVEDLQAKLKWATEKLEANINWEFVAAAKEEMLKAAWAEIKELREKIKEPEQEPVAYEPVWDSGPTNKDMEDAMRIKRLSQLAAPTQPKSAKWLTEERYAQLHTAQLKPLTDEQIDALADKFTVHTGGMWEPELCIEFNDSCKSVHSFARAIEAAHGIKEKNT